VSIHETLAEKFLKSNFLIGDWYPEVPVGFRSVEYNNYPKVDARAVCALGSKNVFHRAIALSYWKEARVSFKARSVWLVEIEPNLSSATLGLPIGQLLTYRVLFRRDHPQASVVGLGIVCKGGNPFVELACKELGMRVWKLANCDAGALRQHSQHSNAYTGNTPWLKTWRP
jgi:hypothetical protein